MLNEILAKVKITGRGISSDTRRSVMNSKISLSNIVKSFDDDREIIKSECKDSDEATFYDLINNLAIQEAQVELSTITTEQFDTLLDNVDLNTSEVELLYKFMLLD